MMVLTVAMWWPGAALAQTPAAVDVPATRIQGAVKQQLDERASDRIISLVDTTNYNVATAVVLRRLPGVPGTSGIGNVGGALGHDKVTEVYYILRGGGMQVTGGALVNGTANTVSAATGPGRSGEGIQNGRNTRLAQGDILIIPAGVPHMWSSIDEGGVDYLVFRVDPEKVLSPGRAGAPSTPQTASGRRPTDATVVTSAEVQALVTSFPKDRTSDRLLTLTDIGYGNFGVAVVARAATPAGAGALSHDKITEIYYMLRGSGTQVTGGTIANAKPNTTSAVIGPSISGTRIENGRDSRLASGDVQVIPPNVPHMWSVIDPGGVEYLVLRVDPERVVSMTP